MATVKCTACPSVVNDSPRFCINGRCQRCHAKLTAASQPTAPVSPPAPAVSQPTVGDIMARNDAAWEAHKAGRPPVDLTAAKARLAASQPTAPVPTPAVSQPTAPASQPTAPAWMATPVAPTDGSIRTVDQHELYCCAKCSDQYQAQELHDNGTCCQEPTAPVSPPAVVVVKTAASQPTAPVSPPKPAVVVVKPAPATLVHETVNGTTVKCCGCGRLYDCDELPDGELCYVCQGTDAPDGTPAVSQPTVVPAVVSQTPAVVSNTAQCRGTDCKRVCSLHKLTDGLCQSCHGKTPAKPVPAPATVEQAIRTAPVSHGMIHLVDVAKAVGCDVADLGPALHTLRKAGVLRLIAVGACGTWDAEVGPVATTCLAGEGEVFGSLELRTAEVNNPPAVATGLGTAGSAVPVDGKPGIYHCAGGCKRTCHVCVLDGGLCKYCHAKANPAPKPERKAKAPQTDAAKFSDQAKRLLAKWYPDMTSEDRTENVAVVQGFVDQYKRLPTTMAELDAYSDDKPLPASDVQKPAGQVNNPPTVITRHQYVCVTCKGCFWQGKPVTVQEPQCKDCHDKATAAKNSVRKLSTCGTSTTDDSKTVPTTETSTGHRETSLVQGTKSTETRETSLVKAGPNTVAAVVRLLDNPGRPAKQLAEAVLSLGMSTTGTADGDWDMLCEWYCEQDTVSVSTPTPTTVQTNTTIPAVKATTPEVTVNGPISTTPATSQPRNSEQADGQRKANLTAGATLIGNAVLRLRKAGADKPLVNKLLAIEAEVKALANGIEIPANTAPPAEVTPTVDVAPAAKLAAQLDAALKAKLNTPTVNTVVTPAPAPMSQEAYYEAAAKALPHWPNVNDANRSVSYRTYVASGMTVSQFLALDAAGRKAIGIEAGIIVDQVKATVNPAVLANLDDNAGVKPTVYTTATAGSRENLSKILTALFQAEGKKALNAVVAAHEIGDLRRNWEVLIGAVCDKLFGAVASKPTTVLPGKVEQTKAPVVNKPASEQTKAPVKPTVLETLSSLFNAYIAKLDDKGVEAEFRRLIDLNNSRKVA